MTEQLGIEGNAVIGNLEIENIQLRDEAEAARKELTIAHQEVARANQRIAEEHEYSHQRIDSFRRMVKGDKSAVDALDFVRNILDETYPQDDDYNMGALRQIMLNDSDIEKQLDAEESVPF